MLARAVAGAVLEPLDDVKRRGAGDVNERLEGASLSIAMQMTNLNKSSLFVGG